MRARVVFTSALAFALTCGVSGWFAFSTPEALACGGMFVRRLWKDERRPSLAYEQTLLIHDAVKEREHFIREVTFRAAKEPFGFVVPTPTRPEVAKVSGDPFERLRAMFPFRERPASALDTAGMSGGGVSGRSAVRVLEQKKIGSFTAFVLTATDPKALKAWLDKHDLTSSPEADAWLDHYVKMGFFYVAMRYSPPADAEASAQSTQAEVVRFSFDTPLPYYPYFEPAPPKGQRTEDPRMLELWVVSQRSGVPVALQDHAGGPRWTRPFIEGQTLEYKVREDLEHGLGAEKTLLPAGEIIIQHFVDQKSSRVGYGDVLFVPPAPMRFDEADRKKLTALLPILDPSLAGSSDAKKGE